ncbi:unnamed protein product [Discosporangium mesarthrocarpum]
MGYKFFGFGKVGAFVCPFLLPAKGHWWSDANGVAMGVYCPERQVWWHHDFSQELRERMQKGNVSINVLALLAMVVSGWFMAIEFGDAPAEVGEPVLMQGDNMAVVQWVKKCGGPKEPRAALTLCDCLGF